MSEDNLIIAYEKSQMVELAKVISANIDNYFKNPSFLSLDMSLIYKVLDVCPEIDPKKVADFINNLWNYKEIYLPDILSHIKTDKKEVSKLLDTSDHYQFSNVSLKNIFMENDLKMSKMNELVTKQSGEICELTNKISELEKIIKEHVGIGETHKTPIGDNKVDYYTIISKLTYAFEQQQMQIDKVKKFIKQELRSSYEDFKKSNATIKNQLNALRSHMNVHQNAASGTGSQNSSHINVYMGKNEIKKVSYEIHKNLHEIKQELSKRKENISLNKEVDKTSNTKATPNQQNKQAHNNSSVSSTAADQNKKDTKLNVILKETQKKDAYLSDPSLSLFQSNIVAESSTSRKVTEMHTSDISGIVSNESVNFFENSYVTENNISPIKNMKDSPLKFCTKGHTNSCSKGDESYDIETSPSFKNGSIFDYFEKGNIEAVLKLINDKPEVINLKNSNYYNFSPLHYAIRGNCIDVCKALIKLGANIDAKDINGGTPLHFASQLGHYEIAKLLIKSGALVNEKTTNGKTALHHASQYNHKNICSLLIKHGASVNEKTQFIY